MPEPKTSTVEVNGFSCRVWTAGSGPKLGFLAGFGGLPKWMPFLDALARQHAATLLRQAAAFRRGRTERRASHERPPPSTPGVRSRGCPLFAGYFELSLGDRPLGAIFDASLSSISGLKIHRRAKR